MSVSDLQIEKFSIWEWIYWSGAYPVYWKMFQPYDWDDIVPSSWNWEDIYTLNETTSFDCYWFQQWNEVFAWTILISNQGSSSVSFHLDMYLDQKINWSWQNPWTSNYDFWYKTIQWKTDDTTWAWWWAFWWGMDNDEIRPWISDYRLRLYADSRLLDTIYFDAYNITFDDTVCNAGYMWVEWSNICYVPPCYYSWSDTTWYKHRIQYDTWYSWATWQTPWMIWIPDDSSDWHIYYTTSNWVVRRTKETYPRVPTSSVGSSRRWHIWMTPSTYYSTEETGYNYICYVDYAWRKRRLWVWDVD